MFVCASKKADGLIWSGKPCMSRKDIRCHQCIEVANMRHWGPCQDEVLLEVRRPYQNLGKISASSSNKAYYNHLKKKSTSECYLSDMMIIVDGRYGGCMGPRTSCAVPNAGRWVLGRPARSCYDARVKASLASCRLRPRYHHPPAAALGTSARCTQ